MNKELKACPFCGGEPQLKVIGNDYTKKRSVLIRCPKCRIQVTNSALRNSMEWLIDISIKEWNTRTSPPHSEAVKLLTRVKEWRGLDGDGISDPLRREINEFLGVIDG